jgi:hypothetical protein
MPSREIDLRLESHFIDIVTQWRSRPPRHRQDYPLIGHFAAVHAVEKFGVRRYAAQVEEIGELSRKTRSEEAAEHIEISVAAFGLEPLDDGAREWRQHQLSAHLVCAIESG